MEYVHKTAAGLARYLNANTCTTEREWGTREIGCLNRALRGIGWVPRKAPNGLGNRGVFLRKGKGHINIVNKGKVYVIERTTA